MWLLKSPHEPGQVMCVQAGALGQSQWDVNVKDDAWGLAEAVFDVRCLPLNCRTLTVH